MQTKWHFRRLTEDDYDIFVRFYAELGIDDTVPDPARWRAEWMEDSLLLLEGPTPVGYGLLRATGPLGHVVHVVTSPAARGRGVGRAVMSQLAARLRAEGCSRWGLTVKRGNVAAIRLYESLGMKDVADILALSLPWERVSQLPRGPESVLARPVQPEQDARLEHDFGMPAGQLSRLRAKPGRFLVQLVDCALSAEEAVGIACFDPWFPGAAPFLLKRADLARPMLEALRPHARPTDTYVRLVIENAPELSTLLLKAGAEIKVDLVRMEGELPLAPAGLGEPKA